MGSINCRELAKSYSNDGSPTGSNENFSYDLEMNFGHIDDIHENEIKKVEITENLPILLVKQDGRVSAVGAKCPHYGAPLEKGALGRGRIRCPWHGACFNLKTGDIEDFPTNDSLLCFPVSINSKNEVIVKANKAQITNNKPLMQLAKKDPANNTTFIIVGGGPSGGICAETLRKENFTGRIILINKEDTTPYDRVKVSKNISVELSSMQYRTTEFYKKYDIELILRSEVVNINTQDKRIKLHNDLRLQYDKIYIATGSDPIRPQWDSGHLQNVFTIRTYKDSEEINKLLMQHDMHVVCLGTGFISMEIAASCVSIASSVTVIGNSEYPLKVFGPEIGQRINTLFESNKVKMLNNSSIKNCIGEDGVIKAVQLENDEELPCDLLIIGVGVRPNTGFLAGSDIKLNKDGTIDTDVCLKTQCPDVYVGGDIANSPIYSNHNQLATIGHYQLAQYHGKIAAKNMIYGDKVEMRAVPFFWTSLFGKSFRYSGYGIPTSTKIEGDLDELKFLAYFFDSQDNVIAMTSCGMDPYVVQFAELSYQGLHIKKSDLLGDHREWTKWLTDPHLERNTGHFTRRKKNSLVIFCVLIASIFFASVSGQTKGLSFYK